MGLSRFDLVTIDLGLRLMIQAHGVLDDEILRRTEIAVADILTKYPNTSFFEVKPNKLEE